MARVDKYGFPLNHLELAKYNKNGTRKGHKQRRKTFQGFQTGDIVKAVVKNGRKIGLYEGRVSIRHRGSFNIKTENGTVQGIYYTYCKITQRNDGWNYQKKLVSIK